MDSGKSGTRDLEAESVGRRAENTGGCVKMETVNYIRRSSVRDKFIINMCHYRAECSEDTKQPKRKGGGEGKKKRKNNQKRKSPLA